MEPKVAFFGDSLSEADISIRSGVLAASLLNSASKACRNGFLDTGRPSVLKEGDAVAGEPALLRKGLLEERLSWRPGEERRSGIDGSAIMIAPLVLILARTPNQLQRRASDQTARVRCVGGIAVERMTRGNEGEPNPVCRTMLRRCDGATAAFLGLVRDGRGG